MKRKIFTAQMMDRAYEINRIMMQIDPNLMAEVMAYNNTSLEYDLGTRPDLEKRYKELVIKAKGLYER